tara:strand:- start:124 stop:348 length:225 start_codon:yes stop_codon:yes gene_type:complete
MNDILNDIEKLKEVRSHLDYTSITANPKIIDGAIQEALLIVNKMLAEKHTEVFEFEKQAPDHIQELNNMIKGDA